MFLNNLETSWIFQCSAFQYFEQINPNYQEVFQNDSPQSFKDKDFITALTFRNLLSNNYLSRLYTIYMYTFLYLKQITNKDLLYSTGNSAQCYMAAWMGEEFEGKWIYVYVWLSPIAIHLKQSQHCLSTDYTLIQNKSFFF